MTAMTGVSLPSMVIWGKDDKVYNSHKLLILPFSQICHISGAKMVKKQSPRTKVYVLNNCGHAVSVEKPGKCVRFITRFITEQLKRS